MPSMWRILCSFLCLVAVVADENHDDTSSMTTQEILLRLADTAKGLRWDNRTNWFQGDDVCTWFGITCYSPNEGYDQRRVGHVREIDLAENHLVGSIPPELFELPYLQSLILRNNADLNVSLKNIEEAQHLERLVLSSTATSSLEGISKATALTELHITGLELGGNIPMELFDMTSLMGLYANFNKFTGTLPTEIGLLVHLRQLYLHQNDFTGQVPSEIGQLAQLQILALSQNAFTGSLPEELSQCANMAIMALQQDPSAKKGLGLSGKLPSFATFSKISELYLSYNQLTGSIPTEFLKGAPSQESIQVDLSGNQLSGGVPVELAKLQGLELHLQENQISNVSQALCDATQEWFNGKVGSIGCNAFLCPPQTYATTGRATSAEECLPCDSAQYYGTTSCTTPGSQGSAREILVNFYTVMGGKFWKSSNGWLNPSVEICKWTGVDCTAEKKVTGIRLKNNGLSGTVPADIFSLPSLATLDLSSNAVSVAFKDVSAAANLQVLDLSHTDVTSLVDIGALASTKIRNLKLDSNDFKGNVPSTLFTLETLEELYLSHNKLSGNLSASIGLLTNLKRFRAYGNELNGELPSEIGTLVNLVELDLAENDFTGTLPTQLNQLTSLEKLSIHQTTSVNSLTGPLLAFENLSELTILQLQANRLTGTVPADLLKYTERGNERVTIVLSDNRLQGKVPGAWANRFDDLLLDLSGNQITEIDSILCDESNWMEGTVASFQCDAILCPKGTYNEFGRRANQDSVCRECTTRDITTLGAKRCEGQDVNEEIAILKELYYATGGSSTWINTTGWLAHGDPCDWLGVKCDQYGNVETIDLSGNGLTGTPPASVFNLVELRELYLHHNQLDFRLAGIGNATKLRILHVSDTDLDTLAGIGQAKSLLTLHATDNDLTGTIPNELFGLTNLRNLYLNFNSFSGRLPSEIAELSLLEQLYLFHNKFDGQIPAAIGSMTSLKNLVLSANAFTGTLPLEFNDLTGLEILALEKEGISSNSSTADAEEVATRSQYTHSGAGIHGPLPSLSKLSNLHTLSLGENSLTGTIPYDFLDGIADKSAPIEIALAANKLTGTVPAALTQFDRLEIFLAGNRLTGIADGVCLQSNWLEGQVKEYGCNAIMCPKNMFATYGRQYDQSSACETCPDGKVAPYFGSYECVSEKDLQLNEERDILVKLFSATNGFGWLDSTNWRDTGVSICSWYGITCVSEDEPSVSAIQLQENGLEGKVPTEIFLLRNLKEITFAGDPVEFDFTGIGDAAKLDYLKLDAIGLSSVSGIEAATALTDLHMVDNDFKGVFPTEILSLQNLEMLHISGNSFPTGLPSQLGALGSLKFLSCSDCDLTGPVPSWVDSLTNLEVLELHHNGLNGTMPALSNLVHLEKLDLADQKLRPEGGITGPLPDFSANSKLKFIYLARNSLSGPIPPTLLENTDNAGLVVLDLQWNQLTGTVPAELTRIAKLDLYLANNKIDVISPEICQQAAWNDGAPEKNGCDGILCDKGKFNSMGRATDDTPCDVCPHDNYTQYLGSTQCGPDLDLDVLTFLYVNLGGANWKKSDGWMSGDDVCTWFGITCVDSGEGQGRIQKISLGGNNLEGKVIPQIFELPFLTELDLRENNVTASFSGIANAKQLETLYLSQTKIKSLDGIGSAPALKRFHATDNSLSGPIPEEIFNLASLEELYLNFNGFTGPLSSKIEQLVNLKELFVFHNSLSGSIPSEIGSLVNLEIVALGENKFAGNLPAELNSLSNLEVLSLQREAGLSVTGEGLDGQLPAFDGMPKLKELYLGGNEFGGTIPASFLGGIENKTATIIVDLTFNQIEGAIPSNLADFGDLVLYLAGNKIDDIPKAICDKHQWMNGEVAVSCNSLLCPPGYFNQFGRRVGDDDGKCQACGYVGSTDYYGSTSCEVGDMDGLDERGILFQFYSATEGDSWINRDNWNEDEIDICSWFGVICDEVDGEQTVTRLELPANGLVGTVPPILFHLPSLQVLNMHNNSVDFSFHGIKNAKALEYLNLDGTKITSLDGVGKAKSLITLRVQQNELGGLHIPDEIYELTELQGLMLSESGFEGTISSKIANLVNLVSFNCFRNDLSGELPSEIGSLTKLGVLSLGENNFFGTLPTTMNQLTSLSTLTLDSITRNNAGVSGPLPSFSNLPRLRSLHIRSASLTGTIPDDFLAGVRPTSDYLVVNLKDNGLSGTLPASLSRFSKLYIDVTDNKIEAIDSSLCQVSGWMNGAVGKYQCDAILCPKGTFSPKGIQVSDADVCQTCPAEDASEYLGSTTCAAVQKVHERQVLEKLFTATGGENWKQKDGWMDDNVDICDWYGISCKSGKTVESVLLGSNNLVGTPPAELFELPDLHFLWLYSNPINFSFAGIEKARSLISLLLDSTGLSSLEGIGYAPALVDVDVRFNKLSGSLPSEIRYLHDLQSFSCSHNQLSGEIPSFSTNRNLVTLRLGSNMFTGTLPAFATHRDITSIDVSGNRLTGTVPASLLQAADTSDAIYMDLSSNQLSGTVPGELARFDDLTLYLRDNKIEGINPKLCKESAWNGGDVGKYQCDGILCPANTYSPGLGRASEGGSEGCIRCDKAQHFGSSTCGSSSSSSISRPSGVCLAAALSLLAYFVF